MLTRELIATVFKTTSEEILAQSSLLFNRRPKEVNSTQNRALFFLKETSLSLECKPQQQKRMFEMFLLGILSNLLSSLSKIFSFDKSLVEYSKHTLGKYTSTKSHLTCLFITKHKHVLHSQCYRKVALAYAVFHGHFLFKVNYGCRIAIKNFMKGSKKLTKIHNFQGKL